MDGAIRREVTIAAPLDAVWRAITDERELGVWFGAEVEVEARHGARVRFRMPDGTERRGVVTEAARPARFAFRWREIRADVEGAVVGEARTIAFELTKEGERTTRLVVVEAPWLADSAEALAGASA